MNSHSEWSQGIAQLHAQAAGALKVFVLDQAAMLSIIDGSASGHADTLDVTKTAVRLLVEIKKAKRAPRLCGCCNRYLKAETVYAIVVAIPYDLLGPKKGLAVAIHQDCARTLPAAEKRAMVALQRIWPGIRSVSAPIGLAGHA